MVFVSSEDRKGDQDWTGLDWTGLLREASAGRMTSPIYLPCIFLLKSQPPLCLIRFIANPHIKVIIRCFHNGIASSSDFLVLVLTQVQEVDVSSISGFQGSSSLWGMMGFWTSGSWRPPLRV